MPEGPIDCAPSGPEQWPGGPALLLIPPLGADRHFWDACVAIWRDRVASIAVTPRATRDGPAGPEPVGLSGHVEDLDEARRRFGYERVIVIGCAIGAMIAAAYASRRPDATAGLVMANATPRSSEPARQMLEARADQVERDGIASILPQAVDRAFLNQPRDDRYRRYYDSFARQSPRDYAMACRAAARFDVSGELGRIRCPTLVVPGEHDVLLPPPLSEEVRALVPGAELTPMPGAAHFVPFQATERFAEVVLDFALRAGRVSSGS